MRYELSKKSIIRKAFFVTAIGFLMVLILIILAFIFWPGGNVKDNFAPGFNFLYNNLCDLGRDLAYNGESNMFSRSLYLIGASLLSILMIILFSLLWIPFLKEKVNKVLSIIGSFMGVIQACLYFGIIFTGGDLHIAFLIITQLLEVFSIIIFTIVFFREQTSSILSRYSFLFMGSLAIIYLGFVIASIFIKGDFLLIVRRGAHTFYHLLLTLGYGIQSLGMFLFQKKLEKDKISQP